MSALSVPRRARHRAEVGAELVLELEQQALGGLLADAGHLSGARFLQRHRLREVGTLMPDSTESAVRAPTPEILSSWRKARARVGREAVEQMRVLAHDEMREQRDVARRSTGSL